MIANVIVNNIAAPNTSASSANVRYVRRVPVSLMNMLDAYMFCYTVLLLFMLSAASSMLEFHMLVAGIVMLYILELIMEIMPNYLT